jgi:hypothetical protein
MADGLIAGLRDFDQIYEGAEFVEEEFAFISESLLCGWKLSCPIVVPEYHTSPELPLYLPLTEKGELIVVNGYLVGASVDEFQQDYRKIKWQEA